MSEEEMDAREWVTIRSFDDQLAAEMMLNFLRDHDITVTVLGNSIASTMLNRFNTVLDIRLAVPHDELEQAQEALRGFEPEGDLELQPFRGPTPYRQGTAGGVKDGATDDDKPLRRRYRRAAILFAWIFPFGGGHFYAQHHAAGLVYTAAIVAAALVAFTAGGINLGLIWFVFAAADAVTAPAAVTRYNENRVPSVPAQIQSAVMALFLAGMAFIVFEFCR